MSHYDPMHDLGEYDTPTPAALGEDYQTEPASDPTPADIQSTLAMALVDIGPQTFDDTAKWHAVQNIIEAMEMVDAHLGTTTELQLETTMVEQEGMLEDGNTIEVPQDEISVRVSRTS